MRVGGRGVEKKYRMDGEEGGMREGMVCGEGLDCSLARQRHDCHRLLADNNSSLFSSCLVLHPNSFTKRKIFFFFLLYDQHELRFK